MGTSLTIVNEPHYVPPSNLFLEDFGDREDTPLRPPVVSAPEVVFSSPNPIVAFHVLVRLSFTLNISPSSSTCYIHISIEAFKQLLDQLDMIQETQANIQYTQQQPIQRVDDLTMAVQQWKSSFEKSSIFKNA